MRKMIRKYGWVAVMLAALLLAGCCESPNAIKQIQAAYNQAQAMAYGPDGQLLPDISKAINDPRVKEGVAAADLALSLGGMLKDQYCASQPQVAQVQAATATAAANLNPQATLPVPTAPQ